MVNTDDTFVVVVRRLSGVAETSLGQRIGAELKCLLHRLGSGHLTVTLLIVVELQSIIIERDEYLGHLTVTLLVIVEL